MCLYGIKQHKERQFLPNKEIFQHLIIGLLNRKNGGKGA